MLPVLMRVFVAVLLALAVVASAQAAGGICAFIDMEHELDVAYARKLGVDIDSLILAQPESGEQALSIAEALMLSGGIDLIVVDSVAALVPQAELEGEIGDSHMGLQARLMSQFFRKINPKIDKCHTHLLMINQVRSKIGVVYGPSETTSGGNALKFYATHRLTISRGEKIEKAGVHIGNKAKIKCVKNKIAPPFREATVDLIFGQGFDKFSDIIRIGIQRGILNKSGSWYSYGQEKIGQGEAQVCDLLRESPDLFEEIRNKIVATEEGVEDVSPFNDDNDGGDAEG